MTLSIDGCTDTIYKNIYIKPEFTFYIPNTFTPANDGLNDFFAPQGIGLASVESFEMYIYNPEEKEFIKPQT